MLREARKAKQELKALKKDAKKEERKCKKAAKELAKEARIGRSRSKLAAMREEVLKDREPFITPNDGPRTERANTCCQPQY